MTGSEPRLIDPVRRGSEGDREVGRLAAALRRIARALRTRRGEDTPLARWILHILERDGVATARDLARRTGAGPGTLRRTLARLAAKRRIARLRAWDEPRRRRIVLTVRGRAALRHGPPPALALFEEEIDLRPAEKIARLREAAQELAALLATCASIPRRGYGGTRAGDGPEA